MTGSYCFGVDVGGTTVKTGLFSLDGELVEKWEIPTYKGEGGSLILDDITRNLKEKMRERCIAPKQVQGIGLGVPGAVTPDGMVNKCINLGWGVLPVEKLLSEKMDGIPVKAGNDANMAALGEYEAGAGKQYKSLVFITIGTGVGGGIIVDGKPLTGSHGAAAEIGHLPVLYEGEETCNCGKKGCLEQVASAPGIVRMAGRLLDATDQPSALRNVPHLSAKVIFDQAKLGDSLACEVAEKTGWYLGIALAHAGCMIDPQAFIIGGGVSGAGDFFLDIIRKSYRANVFHASRNAEILLATLGNDAGMYGAAYLVINACSRNGGWNDLLT